MWFFISNSNIHKLKDLHKVYSFDLYKIIITVLVMSLIALVAPIILT